MTIWKPFPKRDQKFAGVVIMILGSVVGRSVAGAIGDWPSLFILAALRVVTAFSFLLCPHEKPSMSLPSSASTRIHSEETTPSTSGAPSRNISALDFSRFNTISSMLTIEDPNNRRHLARLEQSDTINTTN